MHQDNNLVSNKLDGLDKHKFSEEHINARNTAMSSDSINILFRIFFTISNSVSNNYKRLAPDQFSHPATVNLIQ